MQKAKKINSSERKCQKRCYLSGARDEVKWQNRNYNPEPLSCRLTKLTWGKDDNRFKAQKFFVCDVQLSEWFDQLLLDPERHSGHLHLCASQWDHTVIACSVNTDTSNKDYSRYVKIEM